MRGALIEEANRRALRMIEGVQEFQSATIEREPAAHQVIWEKANARLLDYGGANDGPLICCVPSLINRHHIFDIYPQRSLIRFLKCRGYRVTLLDWGAPGPRERRYGCSEYVDYLLLEALDFLHQSSHAPIHLMGYCMGGILALAAAQLMPQQIASLSLLATPWDFSAAPPLDASFWQRFETTLQQMEEVPPLVTQTIFHLQDPWHFQQKFTHYSDMSDARKRHFAAVEHWVNDGVPLSRYVARECYIKWPRDNVLMRRQWQVRSQAIDPRIISCPTFIAMPKKDRIVPLHSSEPLAKKIPHADCIFPETGHVSMLVGEKAKQVLWTPLADWLAEQS